MQNQPDACPCSSTSLNLKVKLMNKRAFVAVIEQSSDSAKMPLYSIDYVLNRGYEANVAAYSWNPATLLCLVLTDTEVL